MTIELWLLPAAVTAFAFWQALRHIYEITDLLGGSSFHALAKSFVWASHLLWASVISVAAWAVWAALA